MSEVNDVAVALSTLIFEGAEGREPGKMVAGWSMPAYGVGERRPPLFTVLLNQKECGVFLAYVSVPIRSSIPCANYRKIMFLTPFYLIETGDSVISTKYFLL